LTEVNGGSLGSLRESNRVRVVDALRRCGRASRSDLARMTGLSRTTVGSVVADLQARGLVAEQAERRSEQPARGRPPIFLRIEPKAGVTVGIDFDHDRVRVALADLSTTVLGEDWTAIDVDHSATDAIDAAVEMVEELRRSADVDTSQLVGAGISLAGPIDARTGTIGSSPILPGWAGRSPRKELAERLGLHVEIDNDANLGALAEASFGAGRGLSDIVYVRLGSGLGAGLVLGGRLHRGASGLAGELGHVQVDPAGVVCRCGSRGCLETVAAGRALAARLRPLLGPDANTCQILALVKSGEPAAVEAVREAGRAIGRVLANLCIALNPEAVIVGGELGDAGEPLLAGIRESVDRLALPGSARAVDVVSAELGEHAEVLGALTLIIGNTERLRSIGLAAFARPRIPGTRASRWSPATRKEEVLAGIDVRV
jgi:predicted NBD/HSP70 family sugar kinase